VGPTLGQPTFYSSLGLVEDPKAPGYAHTGTIIGAANGVFYGGGFVGTCIAGWLADRFGRLNGFRIAGVVGVIGAVIQTASVNQPMVSAQFSTSDLLPRSLTLPVSGCPSDYRHRIWSNTWSNADLLL
jgi:MFS family permease